MKSAYELALERLEEQGIERPREGSIDSETQQEIAEIRQRTEATCAKLEILLQDRLKGSHDPDARAVTEKEYVTERRRLEQKRDREIEKLRTGS